MSLLDNLRKGTESTAMKVFFVIVVVVFVFWGVDSRTSNGPTSNVIAEVGGDPIKDVEYQRRMRDITSRVNLSPDEDQIKELGRKVIQDLIQEKAMLQTAEQIGLEVSDEELARFILQYDAFKDNDGKFNTKLYERHLKRLGLNKGRFEEQAREAMLLQKMQALASQGGQVLEPQVKRRYLEENTQLELQFVRIPDDLVLGKVPVDDAAIDTFLSTNEAEAKAAYDADFERLYNLPRKATLRTILLRSDLPAAPEGTEGAETTLVARQKIDAILAEARGGADFAALATKYSEDLTAAAGGLLGNMSERQLDPAITTAVFATTPGAITDVVETGRGLQILKVESIEDAKTIQFDEVKKVIARDLIARKEVARVGGEIAEKILAAWKETGSPPQALLDEHHLVVTESGAVTPGQPPLQLQTSPAVLDAALAKAQTGVLDGVYPMVNGRVIGAVTRFEAANMDDYEAKAEALRLMMLYETRNAFMERWTKDVVAQANVKQHYNP